MFKQRQTQLEKVLLSAAAVLLLTTAGQSAVLTDDLQTTATPAPSNATLTTQLNNGSTEEPQVLQSFRSCRNEHVDYCKNGGKCIFPQDTDKPACICTSYYSGERCLFISDHTRSPAETEQLIAIIFGVVMLIIALAIIIFCLVYRRCIKSAPLIKSAPSESTV